MCHRTAGQRSCRLPRGSYPRWTARGRNEAAVARRATGGRMCALFAFTSGPPTPLHGHTKPKTRTCAPFSRGVRGGTCTAERGGGDKNSRNGSGDRLTRAEARQTKSICCPPGRFPSPEQGAAICRRLIASQGAVHLTVLHLLSIDSNCVCRARIIIVAAAAAAGKLNFGLQPCVIPPRACYSV